MAREREYDDEPEEDDEPPRRPRRRRDEDDAEDDRPRRRRPREEPEMGEDPALRMLFPVGRSGWAIASGYLGLISVLCLPSPLALFTGIMALREMKRNPKKHGMGRAIFGLVMGSIGTILLALFLVLAAFKGN